MSWVTVIWSMVASACLTLAVIYFLVWCRKPTVWAHLLFSVTAVSTTAYAICELAMMRAQTPAEFIAAVRWAQLPMGLVLVSMTWFVWTYLRAGRPWLAWTILGLRGFFLMLTFLAGINVNYLAVPSLRQIQFLGESITVPGGVPNPLTLLGQFGVVLIIIFVADASVTAWRRGDRRRAGMVGGGVLFFLLTGLVTLSVVFWGNVPAPIVVSQCYLGVVVVMAYELSHDVLRASQLAQDLQTSEAGLRESETRMSLAVEAADFGIWIRDLARNEIWASERWRELFGFARSEPLEFDTILKRLHPDDREGLQHALAMAVKGVDGGKHRTEFRLMLPDGEIRWISSQGHVEWDATGQPVLIRGAARDVTTRKRAEVVVRNLSGRLLSAQEEERSRIARELHDNLSQQVALLAIEIEQLSMTSGYPAAVAESMRQLGGRTTDISREIHSLSHRLHSTKLEALGLQAAVQGHCRELRAGGFQVQCLVENVPRALPYEVALCLFRIVQEGLNNVVKHSGAREAQLTLTGTRDGLLLTIADSGRGFDEAAASVQGGLGLASMRERVQYVGGELTLESKPGHGARIVARVPIAEVEQAAAGAPA